VLEGEERVARQLVLIKELDLAGWHEDARAARELLGTLTETPSAGAVLVFAVQSGIAAR